MNLKVEWFRERSADCAKLAAAARDTEAATMLKDMADKWQVPRRAGHEARWP